MTEMRNGRTFEEDLYNLMSGHLDAEPVKVGDVCMHTRTVPMLRGHNPTARECYDCGRTVVRVGPTDV